MNQRHEEMLTEARMRGVDRAAFESIWEWSHTNAGIRAWLMMWHDKRYTFSEALTQMVLHLAQTNAELQAQLIAAIESKPVAYVVPFSEAKR